MHNESEIRVDDHLCPLCGENDYQNVFDLLDDVDSLSIPGWLVRCRNCNMWFKIQSKSNKYMEVYGEDYASREYLPAYMAGEKTYAFFRKVLKGVREKSNKVNGKPPRLLDVGTGLGTMIEAAQEAGFDDRTLRLMLKTSGFEVDRVKFFPYCPLIMRKGMSMSFANSIAVSFIELLGMPFKRVFRMLYYASKTF